MKNGAAKPHANASPPDTRTPLERMADLTRRVVAVPKSEVVKTKKRKKP